MSDDTLDIVKRSPVLRGVQAAIFARAQELVLAAQALIAGRFLDNAQGKNLEVIGRIVGEYPRPTIDAGTLQYFMPDTPGQGADSVTLWVTHAPTFGTVAVDDIRYRVAIRSKILKNHTRHGSAPELMWYALQAYGIPVSVKNEGSGDVSFVVPVGTDAEKLAALSSAITDNNADMQYAMPLPATARIVAVKYRYPNAFAPDLPSGRVDFAFLGVGYVVGA